MATIVQVPASSMGSSSGIFFSIKVDPKSLQQLAQIERGIMNTMNVANNPQTVSSGIANIGQQWLYNWAQRGSRVGGWKELSEYTKRVKEERGYGGKRILEQSGSFYKGGLAGFASWVPGQTSYEATIAATPSQLNADYSTLPGYGEATGVGASVNGRRFTAVMNGPKAMNQMGGGQRFGGGFERGFAGLPARPFWFFDQKMIDDSAEIMMNNFAGRWVENMPNPVGAANRAVLGLGVYSVSESRFR